MEQEPDILAQVQASAKVRILFLPLAIEQMLRPDRMIMRLEVRQVVQQGEVIEDYPEDVRGHSCLILGSGIEGRPVHVVCSPKKEYLTIITAYIPSEQEWTNDFRTRVNL